MQERTRKDLRMSREERDVRFLQNLTRIVGSIISWYAIEEKESAHRMITTVMHDLCRKMCIYSFRIVQINQRFSRLYVQRNKSVQIEQVDYGW